MIFVCVLTLFCSIFSSTASAKFINTFLIKIGGDPFTNNDATAKYLAQYDLIITRKMQSRNISFEGSSSYGSTWRAIKQHNPNTEIHLYTQVNSTNPSSDSWPIYSLNNISRYGDSRGHSDGKLKDHNNYFLHRNGAKLGYFNNGSLKRYHLDPGVANFQAYALEATLNDHKDQSWSADGIYTDVLASQLSHIAPTDEYGSQNAWSAAVKSLVNYLTKGLNAQGQTFSINHGPTRVSEVKTHWKALNAINNPPKYLLEEGAHAHIYGTGDINFLHENSWKNQIDTIVAMTNIGYLSAASSKLFDLDDTGIDNFGKSFSGWDALYFAMASYCLGKDDKDAFYFKTADLVYSYSRWDSYYDEYDLIDLGAAVGSYQVTKVGGNNIYYREFADGYVYVNPTPNNVASIQLPEPCKRRTHGNLYKNLDSLPNLSTIGLNAHRAAFLYKSDSAALPPPSQLQIIE
jgi:hypothetical protein